METELLLSFFGASVLLILMPGPDNIFVLTESLTRGSKTGISISVGLASGILIHTVAAATGLSIIIQKSAVAFSVIKYLGAGYLLFLAYKAAQEKRPALDLKRNKIKTEKSFFHLIRIGFLMNILNPKVALFFIAFFPQFVSKDGYGIIIQMILLGGIFMVLTLLIFCSIAWLSGRLSGYLNSSRFWKITKWSKVGVLSMLGLILILAKG